MWERQAAFWDVVLKGGSFFISSGVNPAFSRACFVQYVFSYLASGRMVTASSVKSHTRYSGAPKMNSEFSQAFGNLFLKVKRRGMNSDSLSISRAFSFHSNVSPVGATRVGPFPLTQIPSSFSCGFWSKISLTELHNAGNHSFDACSVLIRRNFFLVLAITFPESSISAAFREDVPTSTHKTFILLLQRLG